MSDEVTEQAVRAVLLNFGISTDDPIASQQEFATLRGLVKTMADPEFQKDLKAIREWRVAQETFKKVTLITILTTIITGAIAAVVWAFQTALHLPPSAPTPGQ